MGKNCISINYMGEDGRSKADMGKDGMRKNGMNNNGMGDDDGISWTCEWRYWIKTA